MTELKPIALVTFNRGIPSSKESSLIKRILKKELEGYCVVVVFDEDSDKSYAEIEIIK
jgi:hypothetical protein